MSLRGDAKRAALATAALLLASADASCGKQALTQIVVVVDSDWDGFERLHVAVDGFEHPWSLDVGLQSPEKALPRRFALVHEGGPLGPLTVTVSAYASDETPVLVEPRSQVYFERGQTVTLAIELLYHCIGACHEGEACVRSPRCGATCEQGEPGCQSSDQLGALPRWKGSVDALDTAFKVKAGAVLGMVSPDGALLPLAGLDAATDAGGNVQRDEAGSGATRDSGGSAHEGGGPSSRPSFGYAPSNFDPSALTKDAAAEVELRFDCGVTEFDSDTLEFKNVCGAAPSTAVVMQDDASEAAVIVARSITVAKDATLQLGGSRPVILAAFGDASIDGRVEASAHAGRSGPGAGRACAGGAGSGGPQGVSATSAGGGSGGGFGSQGGAGGANFNGTRVSGGVPVGSVTLVPLRGGCSGGSGGVPAVGGGSAAEGGGGGGAVQVSAAGTLVIAGVIAAGGGGGGPGPAAQFGGAGGGSGGAILLEGAEVTLASSAVISANGGGGGGGEARFLGAGPSSKAGEDGQSGSAPAAGGAGSAHAGGGGAALTAEAASGADEDVQGAGSGGGGGAGRIRINRANACAPSGTISPAPEVRCPSCGACPPALPSGCHALDRNGHAYYRCDVALAQTDARLRCQAMGVDLVEIDDSGENDWLAQQLAAETWIGASDASQEGEWIWIRDGSPFWSGGPQGAAISGAFSAWSVGEPNNIDSTTLNSDCAAIQPGGSWLDRACDVTLAYVCE